MPRGGAVGQLAVDHMSEVAGSSPVLATNPRAKATGRGLL